MIGTAKHHGAFEYNNISVINTDLGNAANLAGLLSGSALSNQFINPMQAHHGAIIFETPLSSIKYKSDTKTQYDVEYGEDIEFTVDTGTIFDQWRFDKITQTWAICPYEISWRRYEGGSWVILPGETSPTLSLKNVTTEDSGQYYARVSYTRGSSIGLSGINVSVTATPPPVVPPVNPPIKPPINPPVSPPVSPPVNPPVKPPVNPPTNPVDNNNQTDDDNHNESETIATPLNVAPVSDVVIENETTKRTPYMSGYPDKTFRPDNMITRVEMAMVLFRLTEDSNKTNFLSSNLSDIKSDEWYSQAVSYLSSKGVIVGYPEGDFKPDNNLTRAEFAVLISKFFRIDSVNGESFSDVDNSHFAYDYIAALHQSNIVSGYPDKSFKPNNHISRAEVVKVINSILNRYWEGQDLDLFVDIDKKHWSYYDVLEATAE